MPEYHKKGIYILENKKLEFCPYDNIVPFKCDIDYRTNESCRQKSKAFYKEQEKNIFVSENVICECDPEICPRYVKHMIENLTKYKQNAKNK